MLRASIVLCATSVCLILTIIANGLTTVLEARIIGKHFTTLSFNFINSVAGFELLVDHRFLKSYH